ncbi:DAK2 domain-containing protein, partial [Streptomyces sp. UNOC14_S4]|nr:DAK2 domain-containing protein [Streptomyces sp. UNOC14_S4]
MFLILIRQPEQHTSTASVERNYHACPIRSRPPAPRPGRTTLPITAHAPRSPRRTQVPHTPADSVRGCPRAAAVVRTWCALALDALGRAREEIDAINVYPVADGDTGTNLYLTVESASRAVEAVFDGHATADPAAPPTLPEVVRAMAHGALIGARGNSGTILAQLLRGTAEVLAAAPEGAEGGELLRAALERAVASAYEGVARPVEGTVLTVAAAAARAAAQTEGDAPAVARAADEAARTALAVTPGQLDVLGEAGVVDAGGLGLVEVLGALARALSGETAPVAAYAWRTEAVTPSAPEPRPTRAWRPARTEGCHPELTAGGGPVGPAFEVIYL